MDKDSFSIEIGLGVEAVLGGLFDAFNVPDELFEAYNIAFPGLAAQESLGDHYAAMVDRGPESVRGFISALKGKVAELHTVDQLHGDFPGYTFNLADSATQPGWDIFGLGPDGHEVLIQVKSGASSYADAVSQAMTDSHDTMFAVSSEVHDAVLTAHPELVERLLDLDWIDYELTHSVHEGLSTLAGHLNFDVPDGLGDILPFVGEIILGIRLLYTIRDVRRDYGNLEAKDQARIGAVKTLVLFSRYGVSAVVTAAGVAAGTVLGPGGIIAGGVGGAVVSMQINKRIKPYMIEIALTLMNLTQDDLFYFRNKVRIDGVGASLARFADFCSA